MVRYLVVQVTSAVGVEDPVPALTGQEGRKRRVRSIIPTQGPDLNFRAYIEQDQIIDAPANLFGVGPDPRFLVDRDLAVGESLSVAYLRAGGAPAALAVTIEYEE